MMISHISVSPMTLWILLAAVLVIGWAVFTLFITWMMGRGQYKQRVAARGRHKA
jgi:hypothetical protein